MFNIISFEISNINVIDQVDNIYSHFYYNKKFKIFICSTCYVCIIKTSLKKHLSSIYYTHNNKKDYSTLFNIVSNLDIREFFKLDTSINY